MVVVVAGQGASLSEHPGEGTAQPPLSAPASPSVSSLSPCSALWRAPAGPGAWQQGPSTLPKLPEFHLLLRKGLCQGLGAGAGLLAAAQLGAQEMGVLWCFCPCMELVPCRAGHWQCEQQGRELLRGLQLLFLILSCLLTPSQPPSQPGPHAQQRASWLP